MWHDLHKTNPVCGLYFSNQSFNPSTHPIIVLWRIPPHAAVLFYGVVCNSQFNRPQLLLCSRAEWWLWCHSQVCLQSLLCSVRNSQCQLQLILSFVYAPLANWRQAFLPRVHCSLHRRCSKDILKGTASFREWMKSQHDAVIERRPQSHWDLPEAKAKPFTRVCGRRIIRCAPSGFPISISVPSLAPWSFSHSFTVSIPPYVLAKLIKSSSENSSPSSS